MYLFARALHNWIGNSLSRPACDDLFASRLDIFSPDFDHVLGLSRDLSQLDHSFSLSRL